MVLIPWRTTFPWAGDASSRQPTRNDIPRFSTTTQKLPDLPSLPPFPLSFPYRERCDEENKLLIQAGKNATWSHCTRIEDWPSARPKSVRASSFDLGRRVVYEIWGGIEHTALWLFLPCVRVTLFFRSLCISSAALFVQEARACVFSFNHCGFTVASWSFYKTGIRNRIYIRPACPHPSW